MIKGIAFSPKIVGRISIGSTDESESGEVFPVADDQFHLTSLVQEADMKWEPSLFQSKLSSDIEYVDDDGRLVAVPVRVLFNEVENNIQTGYVVYDAFSRPKCVGDGEKANREVDGKSTEVDCPGPDRCEYGKTLCKRFGRLLVGLEQTYDRDPLAAYAFRTTSINSIRNLVRAFSDYAAITGGKMRGMPLILKLVRKSSVQSMYRPFYFVELAPADSFEASIKAALDVDARWRELNLDGKAFEESVAAGIKNGVFFEDGEDNSDIVREFVMGPAPAKTVVPIDSVSQVGSPSRQVDESSAAQAVSSGVVVSPEMLAQIDVLKSRANLDLRFINQWLHRPPDAPLDSMTQEDAERCLFGMKKRLGLPQDAVQ